MKTYENIRKIATDQGVDYTTDCLTDYVDFKNYFKKITTDLENNKHQMLIQKQHNKSILPEIQVNQHKQQSF